MDLLPVIPPLEPVIELWDFADAPEEYRLLVPPSYADGWIALVRQPDLVEHILSLSDARGLPVRCHQYNHSATVLCGPHPW